MNRCWIEWKNLRIGLNNLKCDRCNEEMKKMTVCHQICDNCGAVVDCSDGVMD